ncbi:integrase catalytic domain-containing protein [Trichonephila clavipes]|nr:integrase catalytic domain-containing protein [Trichonephila clavipes]
MMGDLPRDRIVPSRPFEKVGLDYAGPIITKPNLKDQESCFDLTTEAFLACLRRFIAGDPSHPSFGVTMQRTSRGARNILSEWNEICTSPTEFSYSARKGNRMELHSTRFSHFGGLWEANIKSMKRILLRWKLVQSLRDKFWNRWSTEYLTHLQTRAKWSEQNPNLMENQLVLLKDPNTKPWTGLWGVFLKYFR